MFPRSFAGFRFDLGSLLQGQMWFFIPIMANISLVGRRGFGCEDNLWEIMCPIPHSRSNVVRDTSNGLYLSYY